MAVAKDQRITIMSYDFGYYGAKYKINFKNSFYIMKHLMYLCTSKIQMNKQTF